MHALRRRSCGNCAWVLAIPLIAALILLSLDWRTVFKAADATSANVITDAPTVKVQTPSTAAPTSQSTLPARPLHIRSTEKPVGVKSAEEETPIEADVDRVDESDDVDQPLAPSIPKVAAIIAVHPPRFYYVGRFLQHWSKCPAAVKALSVTVVFTGDQDLKLFRETQRRLSPSVSSDMWTGVVCTLPPKIARSHNQHQAAWKKWYGIAHLMDLGPDAPPYGLMLDSELELYDQDACKPDGEWNQLFTRLRRAENAKFFPAARVGPNLVSYNFKGRVMDGKSYDTRLIKENADFAMTNAARVESCDSPGCAEVKRQLSACLFSWWTDLPYLNLTIARRMLAKIAKVSAKKESGWRQVAFKIKFPRFEYIAYQQWCCVNEGFKFRDVTRLTGEAKWGSYLEDPQPGAKINELEPLWISSETLVRSEQGIIPKMSRKAPPLLVFHLDHDAFRFTIFPEKNTWEKTLIQVLQEHGRSDWNAQTIQ